VTAPTEQLPLPLAAPAKKRGGARPGAGRKPNGLRAGELHLPRPALEARYPVHIVVHVVELAGNLRRLRMYHAIRTATVTLAARESFRIVHLGIQRTHLHLLVEADDEVALARGMQAFQISAAKHINRAMRQGRPGPRRRGRVFADRYHAEIITTPERARAALAYVLNGWRKHGEDRIGRMRAWKIDWFSSAIHFADWVDDAGAPWAWDGPPLYEPLAVAPPKTLLLREGWKQRGPLSYREVPAVSFAPDAAP
jgi:REP element-mobilizing transposase RayT